MTGDDTPASKQSFPRAGWILLGVSGLCLVALAALVVLWAIWPLADGHEGSPASSDVPRVRGADVARLFSKPVRPMLDTRRQVRSVRCHNDGHGPGNGGPWYFWTCSVATPYGSEEIAVMWQVDHPEDRDDPPDLARVTARYARAGKRIDECCIDHPLTATARDVEKLFTEPYQTLLSSGSSSVGCRPSSTDPSGLGNPWHCTLDTQSDGTQHEVVRIRPNGSFSSRYSGHGCCITLRPR